MATLELPFAPIPLPGPAPSLGAAAVQVWRVRLDERLDRSTASLSEAERSRAGAMKHEATRLGFTRARAALRLVLAAYAERGPADLDIRLGEHGKPFLDLPVAPYFNLSHSGALALIAVTRAAPVGVDLEFLRPLPRLDDIAARFFAPGETAALAALPEDARLDAFHACWTRKEAFVKAEGSGLANALTHFEVSLRPGDPARLLCVRSKTDAAREWTLHAFRPAEKAWAAICIGAPDVSVTGFELAVD